MNFNLLKSNHNMLLSALQSCFVFSTSMLQKYFERPHSLCWGLQPILLAFMLHKRSLFLYTSSSTNTCFIIPLATVSYVWPGVVSDFYQASAEMPFEAYLVM